VVGPVSGAFGLLYSSTTALASETGIAIATDDAKLRIASTPAS